jgi:hypothetical protein
VIIVYRSPSGELDEFFPWLHDILDQLINKCRSIILLGDLNINIDNKWPDYKELIDIANNFNLTLTITKATRVTDKTATVIVQIMTNIPAQLYHVEVIQSLLSHHYAQSIDCKMNVTAPSKYNK